MLGFWRQSFQTLSVAVLLILPWIQPGGDSLLRIDIASLSLHLFGQVLRIEESYLLLLFVLIVGVGLMLTTLILGRVWCGWICPQTTLNDLTEWLARRCKLQVSANRLLGRKWRKAMVHTGYLLLALLVAANLIWYFIEPQRFISTLLSGSMATDVLLTWIILTLIIYVDLGLIRRLMCRDFCPYGRVQSAFVDPATLTLQLPTIEEKRCIRCNSCVRTCPMEIDIRNGYQIECINCGRCLDACRKIMAKRDEEGLISYTLGVNNLKLKALLNPRVVGLVLLFLLLTSILTIAVSQRTQASLKVAITPTITPAIGNKTLDDDRQNTLLNLWINNRSTDPHTYSLQAFDAQDQPLEIKGQSENISISAGDNRELRLLLISAVQQQSSMIKLLLFDENNRLQATAEARVTPPTSH